MTQSPGYQIVNGSSEEQYVTPKDKCSERHVRQERRAYRRRLTGCEATEGGGVNDRSCCGCPAAVDGPDPLPKLVELEANAETDMETEPSCEPEPEPWLEGWP